MTTSDLAARESVDDPDADLVQRLQHGDEAAFVEIVDRWSSALLGVAFAQTGMRSVAEESVQETWIAVLQGIDRFEGRSSLRTWVFRILLNTCRRRGEREKRTTVMSDVLPRGSDDGPAVEPERFLPCEHPFWPGHWSDPPLSWRRVPDEAALARELRTHLRQAVAALPERQRLVLTMRDVEGWTSQEVCLALDLQPTNQRVLLHRARAAVRTHLEPYLATEES